MGVGRGGADSVQHQMRGAYTEEGIYQLMVQRQALCVHVMAQVEDLEIDLTTSSS